MLLRDRAAEFDEAGVRVFGISRDSIYSHKAWREVLGVTIPLLSDWNGDAVRALGVANRYRGMEDVPIRSAFLVDRDGMIRGSWSYESSEVPDFDVLLAAARAL